MDATVLNRLAQLDYIDGIISYRPVTFHRASRASGAEQEKLNSKVTELLVDIPQKYGKPLVTLGLISISDNDKLVKKALDDAGIHSYPTPEEAVKAMYALVKYAEVRRQLAE